MVAVYEMAAGVAVLKSQTDTKRTKHEIKMNGVEREKK